jgi:multiple sugar transport system substrate-binding protein
MQNLLRLSVGLTMVLGSAGFTSIALADTTRINALFMSQTAYSEQDVRDMTASFEKANPDIKVNLEFVPYEGLHDKTVLAQGSNGYDVVLYDVIWPAEFATNHVLVDVTDRVPPDVKAKILPGAWTTAEYSGRLYGMPWILDTKYLFYNKSMLAKAGIDSPPKTWDELAADAKIIKQKGIVEYPIAWSWAQAEAAVCDYATLVDAYGGKFLDSSGKPVFQNGGGLEALRYMVQTVKDGVTNPNSKEFLEEDVRHTFENGQAAFMLNWTYAYNLANDPKESKVAGQVGIEPALGVNGITTASGVNGSQGLGITMTSQHPGDAWKYIVYMTSQPVQEQYAKLSLPIWASSYDNPQVSQGQEPLVTAAKVSLGVMTPRPLTPKYQQMSQALQVAIQKAVLGTESPQDALKEAADNSGL